jgi:hypothetical protein
MAPSGQRAGMIHYDLRCGSGHGFDGWFPGSAAFERQAADGLLGCPVCGSADVSRALMAPRLGRGLVAPADQATVADKAAVAPPAGATQATAKPPGPPPMPDQVRAVLQRIRAEVEQRCDYVGPRFAETARAMHDGALTPRPIYGETTPDQAEALAEDGIEVARIPWVPRADG